MNWPHDTKNWTLASIAAFAISFTISLVAHVPKERAIVVSLWPRYWFLVVFSFDLKVDKKNEISWSTKNGFVGLTNNYPECHVFT